jgi:hypothetical protein
VTFAQGIIRFLSGKKRGKTAISTPEYHVQYTRLPFGIHLSGHLFNRLMSIVLRSCRHSCAYVDDIITFSDSFPEHLTHLQDLFDRLRRARLKLRPSKCFFALRKLNYLGHTVSAQGIEPDRVKGRGPTSDNSSHLPKAATFLPWGRRILPPVHFKLLSQDSHFQTLIGAGGKMDLDPRPREGI